MASTLIYSCSLPADIEALPAASLPVGTQAYAVSNNGVYTLESSSAAVDHTTVLSVNGVGGLRWILASPLLAVATDATLTGAGTAGSPLHVVLPATDHGTVQTLLADATNVTFAGLNGNVDGDYEISGNILLPASSGPFLYLLANGVTTAQSCVVLANATATNISPWALTGIGTAAGSFVGFTARVSSLSGKNRVVTMSGADYNGVTTRLIGMSGVWLDTTTNLTSLVINTDTTNAIKAGSRFVCRKLGVFT